MSGFIFKHAVRENVGLIIGLAGGTGSGKTYSAMVLAQGISGNKPFAVIDTESGRAKHYADQFNFDHGDLKSPFRPSAYAEAIEAADKAGYPVIVIDSMSHEHAGDGGVLDMHEDELERMAGNDYAKRERCKFTAWIKPKTEHKRMVQRLLQIRAHIILCFRAEEKIEIIKDGDKTKVIPKRTLSGLDGWCPICEKELPFEATCSFLFLATNPGVPMPIKLQKQHRDIFREGQVIDESCGKRLRDWASGSKGINETNIDPSISALSSGVDLIDQDFLASAVRRAADCWVAAADNRTVKAFINDLVCGVSPEVAKSPPERRKDIDDETWFVSASGKKLEFRIDVLRRCARKLIADGNSDFIIHMQAACSTPEGIK